MHSRAKLARHVRVLFFLGAGLLSGMSTSAVAAQPDDNHARLANAIFSERATELGSEASWKQAIVPAIVRDANLQALNTKCPGYLSGYTTTAWPIWLKNYRYQTQRKRVDLIAILKSGLTADEASEAADFFSSELGQRFLTIPLQTPEVTNQLTPSGNENAVMSQEEFDSLLSAIGPAVRDSLTPADRQAIIAEVGNSDWFLSFQPLRPRIRALTLQAVNRGFADQYELEFKEAVLSFTRKHISDCAKK